MAKRFGKRKHTTCFMPAHKNKVMAKTAGVSFSLSYIKKLKCFSNIRFSCVVKNDYCSSGSSNHTVITIKRSALVCLAQFFCLAAYLLNGFQIRFLSARTNFQLTYVVRNGSRNR